MMKCSKCASEGDFVDPLADRWLCERCMIIQVKRYVRKGRPIPGYWMRRFGIHLSSIRQDLKNKPCAYCGSKPTKQNPSTIDHFMPRALGGSDLMKNLRPCCQACNQRKADMHPDAWLELLQQERRGIL